MSSDGPASICRQCIESLYQCFKLRDTQRSTRRCTARGLSWDRECTVRCRRLQSSAATCVRTCAGGTRRWRARVPGGGPRTATAFRRGPSGDHPSARFGSSGRAGWQTRRLAAKSLHGDWGLGPNRHSPQQQTCGTGGKTSRVAAGRTAVQNSTETTTCGRSRSKLPLSRRNPCTSHKRTGGVLKLTLVWPARPEERARV